MLEISNCSWMQFDILVFKVPWMWLSMNKDTIRIHTQSLHCIVLKKPNFRWALMDLFCLIQVFINMCLVLLSVVTPSRSWAGERKMALPTGSVPTPGTLIGVIMVSRGSLIPLTHVVTMLCEGSHYWKILQYNPVKRNGESYSWISILFSITRTWSSLRQMYYF